jgi:hypothetical protein
MMPSDPEYQQHEVFAVLNRYISFYEGLADSVFAWATPGTRGIGNLDSYVFSSVQGTLSSIQSILRRGRLNDAYALLRKYFDSVIISVYCTLYLEDHFAIETFIVMQIDGWMAGTSPLPQYKQMVKYIHSTPRVATITARLDRARYKKIRDRCNAHTHYNFYRHILLNDANIFIAKREAILSVFCRDLRDIFVLHVAYTFFVRQHYMMASDHVDYLECGMAPPEDSQYWVATFVQDVFDRDLAEHQPEIARIMKANTSMHLA